jgi:hypothetical protein
VADAAANEALVDFLAMTEANGGVSARFRGHLVLAGNGQRVDR